MLVLLYFRSLLDFYLLNFLSNIRYIQHCTCGSRGTEIKAKRINGTNSLNAGAM